MAFPTRSRRSATRATRAVCGGAVVGLIVLAAIGPARGEVAAAPDGGSSRVDVASPHLEDVEHMCALLTGCDRLPLPAGFVPQEFGACVRSMQTELSSPSAVAFSLTLRECGLRSSSCGALRTCALRGARAEACVGRGKGGPVDFCDGEGRAITCVNERVATVRDCPRGGEQCAVRDGKAQCALGPCEAEAPPACSASGTRVVECKKGKLVSLDCAAFGLRCAASPSGPRCVTSTPACKDGPPRCEGSVAVTCHQGHEVRVDCAASGLSCGGAGSAVGACTAAPAAASGACDASAPARCDGATIKWCAWGKPRSYLCKSMGLSRCVADEGGAHCAG